MTDKGDDASGSTVPHPVIADRAAGVVVMSAAGDALGAGYEFGPPLPPGTPVRMKGGGGFGWAPGEWTDDTQMALAVLTPLAEGSADLGRVEAGFRAWFASGPADVGNQTRSVLSSSGALGDAAARYALANPDHAAGNGSLMRTGPIALAHPGDPAAIATLAADVSALTHADVDCVDACVLWSVAIDHTIHHAPASDQPWDWAQPVREALSHVPEERRDRWRALIDEATTASPRDFPRNGWVVHAFQAALAAICSTPVPVGPVAGAHLRLALDEAVRAGGDTDTVAAIAGSLLGARWGATALPFEWRRLLLGRRTYDEAPLRATDLERLARLAHRGGRSDAHGWPTAASMLPHYLRDFPAHPLRVELGGVEFGNVAALGEALAAGADTVISLCRMGTADVPDGVEHHALGLLDSSAEENPNLVLLLADVADGLAALRDDGRRPFVHCVQALNRTPAVAAAWLHRHRGLSAEAALDEVAAALNRPNPFLSAALTELAALPVPPAPTG